MRRYFFVIFYVLQGIGLLSAQNNLLTVDEVFCLTSRMNGFQEMKYVEDGIKFPSAIGMPTMIIHGNSDPKAAIIDLLNRLPKTSLVYDNTDERGRFDRMFLDERTNHLLYVHVGLGGNDTVLILFKGGRKTDILDFLSTLNG